jgi:hypothetical protein
MRPDTKTGYRTGYSRKDTGDRIKGTGYRITATEFWMQDTRDAEATEYRIWQIGYSKPNKEVRGRIQDTAYDVGCRIQET